jgi:hypothetical protein
MQDLYLEIQNGLPINHPITGDNLRLLNPNIDLENLPTNIAKFQRNPKPRHSVYDKLDHDVKYEFIDGVVHDIWVVTKMTRAEIKQKQAEAKEMWKSAMGYKSWVFDAEICHHRPPVPYPTDGNHYVWDESTVSWVPFESEIPPVSLDTESEFIPDKTVIDETIDPAAE